MREFPTYWIAVLIPGISSWSAFLAHLTAEKMQLAGRLYIEYYLFFIWFICIQGIYTSDFISQAYGVELNADIYLRIST